MKTLSIDLETFSSVDIKERGRHNYVDSPDFEILLFGYAVDYGQPVVIDLACGESVPQEILKALFDASVKKTAWNAMFEISCFAKVFGLSQDQMCRWTEQWHDTMVQARYCAFPGSLDAAGKALGLPEDKRKIATGKSLIRLFSCPRKPTAKDPRTRVMPSDEPEKWKLYKAYNAGDVTTEMTIAKYLEPWPLPEDVRRQWLLDVVQNERGVPVDMELVDGALRIMAETEEELNREAQQITDLENPNSREQLKAWVERELSTDLADLTKETVEMLLKKDLPDNVRRVLEIRQELSKAAPKKFVAMRDNVCPDGRLRGMMVFYGASRTGRWSSYTVQFQNLLRTHIDGLDFARDLVKRGQAAPVRFCYGNVPDTLGQLVRTALTASGGRILTDCDYSAIEARVIAWLAGEEWALEEFRGEGKIYEATAAQMFNTPKDKIKKGNPEYELRQRGKVATLACIAEGSLVPVKFKDGSIYALPIELVTSEHRVWDGENWVRCEGAVFKGEKEVISYEGLTATADHLVWIEGESRPILFGIAAKSGSHLTQSGPSRLPVWVGKNHQPGEKIYQRMERVLRSDGVRRLSQESMDHAVESDQRRIERLPAMLTTKTDSSVARPQDNGSEAAVPKSKRPWLQGIWRSGDRVQIRFRYRVRALPDGIVPEFGPESGNRPNRHKWALRKRKHSHGNQKEEPGKPKNYSPFRVGPSVLAVLGDMYQKETCGRNDPRRDNCGCRESGTGKEKELARHTEKVRVYDILNAGPHHRFTVQGVLVHNCGFGGGPAAMERMDIGHKIAKDEYPGLVKQWRTANPHIVKYWYLIEEAAMTAMRTGNPVTVNPTGKAPVTFRHEISDLLHFLTLELPSGRKLFYPFPGFTENRFGKESLCYMGQNQKTGKWGPVETYSGKLVENIVQATARDLLAGALARLEEAGFEVIFSIHDEIVIDTPQEIEDSLDRVAAIMTVIPPWAEGLPLNAAGWRGPYFIKD